MPQAASSELRALVRTRDPLTSWDAAEQRLPKRHQVQALVLDILRSEGLLADFEIHLAYERRRAADPTLPPTTAEALRTERSYARNAGLVVDTGFTMLTPRGRQATVWALSPKS